MDLERKQCSGTTRKYFEMKFHTFQRKINKTQKFQLVVFPGCPTTLALYKMKLVTKSHKNFWVEQLEHVFFTNIFFLVMESFFVCHSGPTSCYSKTSITVFYYRIWWPEWQTIMHFSTK